MRKILLLIWVLALLLCSCNQEINEQGNNSSGVHYNNSTEPSNSSSEPYTNSPEIDIASRGWIEIKAETETIDGVTYSVKHCVNLFTSSPYLYTYYKLCYIGDTIRRVDYWTHCPYELVHYEDFIAHLETVEHPSVNNLYSTAHYQSVNLYSPDGKRTEYRIYYGDWLASVQKYDSYGRDYYYYSGSYTSSGTSLAYTPTNQERYFSYFDSGELKREQYLQNGKVYSDNWRWKNGLIRVQVSYSDEHISEIKTYYESGNLENKYNSNNGKLYHYPDVVSASGSVIGTYTDDQIEEWLTTFTSQL